jgi:hypothetical protein
MRYLIQSFLALGALIAAPLLFEAPESAWAQAAAVFVALILAGLAYRGIVGFVNSRRPKHFLDSVMAPKSERKKEDL